MTILGHVQRGGTPTAYDRVLARASAWRPSTRSTRGSSGRWSRCAGRTSSSPLADALAEPKLLDPALYDVAEVFFG